MCHLLGALDLSTSWAEGEDGPVDPQALAPTGELPSLPASQPLIFYGPSRVDTAPRASSSILRRRLGQGGAQARRPPYTLSEVPIHRHRFARAVPTGTRRKATTRKGRVKKAKTKKATRSTGKKKKATTRKAVTGKSKKATLTTGKSKKATTGKKKATGKKGAAKKGAGKGGSGFCPAVTAENFLKTYPQLAVCLKSTKGMRALSAAIKKIRSVAGKHKAFLKKQMSPAATKVAPTKRQKAAVILMACEGSIADSAHLLDTMGETLLEVDLLDLPSANLSICI